MKKEFFMNYAEGQGAPTVKFEDKKEAEKEAARLAETGEVWVSLLTFNRPLQPILLTTKKSDLFITQEAEVIRLTSKRNNRQNSGLHYPPGKGERRSTTSGAII